MDKTYDNAKLMLEKCLEDFDRLSKWEQGFIESMREREAQWKRRWLLTDPQFETLERVYADKTR